MNESRFVTSPDDEGRRAALRLGRHAPDDTALFHLELDSVERNPVAAPLFNEEGQRLRSDDVGKTIGHIDKNFEAHRQRKQLSQASQLRASAFSAREQLVPHPAGQQQRALAGIRSNPFADETVPRNLSVLASNFSTVSVDHPIDYLESLAQTALSARHLKALIPPNVNEITPEKFGHIYSALDVALTTHGHRTGHHATETKSAGEPSIDATLGDDALRSQADVRDCMARYRQAYLYVLRAAADPKLNQAAISHDLEDANHRLQHYARIVTQKIATDTSAITKLAAENVKNGKSGPRKTKSLNVINVPPADGAQLRRLPLTRSMPLLPFRSSPAGESVALDAPARAEQSPVRHVPAEDALPQAFVDMSL